MVIFIFKDCLLPSLFAMASSDFCYFLMLLISIYIFTRNARFLCSAPFYITPWHLFCFAIILNFSQFHIFVRNLWIFYLVYFFYIILLYLLMQILGFLLFAFSFHTSFIPRSSYFVYIHPLISKYIFLILTYMCWMQKFLAIRTCNKKRILL